MGRFAQAAAAEVVDLLGLRPYIRMALEVHPHPEDVHGLNEIIGPRKFSKRAKVASWSFYSMPPICALIFDPTMKISRGRTGFIAAATATAVLLLGGCSTKNYVRSQTAPIVQKTNELDDATAANTRNLHDVDQRAQSGIAQAQQSANSASQSAQAATQAATQAQLQAQEAVNRADSLASVVSGLDSYKQVSDVAVLFGFNKADLTREGKAELDQLASQLTSTKSYILQLTGGTDSVGSAEYNYDLSQRRAAAVVQYLASKYEIPPHRFYLIGIGKDKEVASNQTAAGRAKNRRVEIQLLSNDAALAAGSAVSQAR